ALTIAEIPSLFPPRRRGTLVNGTIVLLIRPHGVCQMNRFLVLLKDDSGATVIEYGLLTAGISIVIIGAVQGIGSSLNARFDTVATQLK
ncbi:MAG: Flp family type IVb pilin, partial [Pseudolabrys sp.]